MRNLAKETLASIASPNVTPLWLLVFLRLARATEADYAKAWKMLPSPLPEGERCPSIVEAAAVLALHRLG